MCKLHLILFSILLVLSHVSVGQDSTDELLAAQYFRDGDFEKAVVLYEKLFEEKPSPVIYNNYLESLLALEEYRKAERVVKDLVKENPGQVQYKVDYGWLMLRQGQDRRSVRHFQSLIREVEASPQAVYNLSKAFEDRGLNDYALETLLRGRRLLASSHPLHLEIARLYEKQGNYQLMMEEYVNYLDDNIREMDKIKGILQEAINNDPGYERNEALRQVLLSYTQKNPDNSLYSEMLLWLSLQQKDFSIAFMQARALDRRLQQQGEIVLEVARLSETNQQYDVASKAYNYLLEKGESSPYYLIALSGYLNVNFLSITSSYNYTKEQLTEVEKEYNEAIDKIGINSFSVSLIRNLAKLQAFYLDKSAEAIELLESTVSIPGVSSRIKSECKVELADILLLTGDQWEATLLYSQVDKAFRDDPLGHEAKFKNARLSFYIGEFDWAKAQLDVLKSGTSRLIANDAMKLSMRIQDNIGFDEDTRPLEMFARAEMLIFRNRFDDALSVLDSVTQIFPAHPIHDDAFFAIAEIYLKTGQYHLADSLLSSIVETFPQGLLADEALFERAKIHHYIFEDNQKAMALYQQLMVEFPGSLNTITARNRFRELRGDILN